MKLPTVILVRGLPGSGKTHLTFELKKALDEDKVVMLDPDATDYDSQPYHEHVKQQTAEGVDPSLHAYRFLRAQAFKGIEEDKIVIWNQPFTNLEIFNKMSAKLREHAAQHNKQLAILVVEVVVDHEIAKQRVQQRKLSGGHGPSDDTFTRFANDYKSFASEGYNTVTIHGDEDVAKSVATVVDALEKL
jgi:predicted ABC-type ATPase